MIDVDYCRVAPDRAEMDPILVEYYALIVGRISALGGTAEGEAAQQQFWEEIDLVLPPKGRLYLARDAQGSLIGMGSLKRLGATGKGELKRLFVRPEARGTGLGRRLVQCRIDAAREMGINELLVDTLKANVEMRGLYHAMGFKEIERYPESSTAKLAPQILPFMMFFRMVL